MKITPKYQIGGFLTSLDNQLNKLGTWGRLGVEMLDPTGITAWKPLKDSAKTFIKSGTLADAGSVLMNGWAAIPMMGVFKAIPKLGKVIKSGRLLKKSGYLLDPQFAKDLINPAKSLKITTELAEDPRAQKEAIRLLDEAISKEVKSCQDRKLSKLTQSQEDKIYKLTEKRSVISGEGTDPNKLINDINQALS